MLRRLQTAHAATLHDEERLDAILEEVLEHADRPRVVAALRYYLCAAIDNGGQASTTGMETVDAPIPTRRGRCRVLRMLCSAISCRARSR